MTIETNPIFYYGVEVEPSSSWIDFQEGELGQELSVQIRAGSYTLEELRESIEFALNGAGDYNYTVSIDRYSRKLTIHASQLYRFLTESGSHSSESLMESISFGEFKNYGDAGDYSGSSLEYGVQDTEFLFIHVSNNPIGECFRPQFCLQDYQDADNSMELRDSSVNETMDGECIEVLYFGENRFYEFNLKYVTNKEMPCGAPISNNPTGVEDANSFLDWAAKKKTIEFMPDELNPNDYRRIRLEKSTGGKSGTGYKLKELIRRNMPDFYESGLLTFRRLD